MNSRIVYARISDELGCSNRALRKDQPVSRITDENFKYTSRK